MIGQVPGRMILILTIAGVLFVDAENPHSLQAHELGLGMARIGPYEFAQRQFWVLVFRCDG